MTIMPQCTFCKHFQGFHGMAGLCSAFPKGIPTKIMNNEVDHKHPYPGDRNIHWEQSADTLESLGAIDLFTETGRPEPALSKAS